jgi:hypothetical protein
MKPPARTLAVAVALVIATTAAAAAATPPTATDDPHGQLAQRKALYQSELERTLARHHALGEQGLAAERKALYQSELERTLARHRALGALAAQPAVRAHPPAAGPGVDVLATLLIGLVGGLLGGAAAMAGWTTTTHRRAHRAGTLRSSP